MLKFKQEEETKDWADLRDTKVCEVCGCRMHLEVLNSFCGFYVGYRCSNCGPYERVSNYFRTNASAQRELEKFKKAL